MGAERLWLSGRRTLMSDWLLALNVGSSSVKFAAHPVDSGAEFLRGAVSEIGVQPQLRVWRTGGADSTTPCGAFVTDLHSAIEHVIDVVFSLLDPAELVGVGHRIVHGGDQFVTPILLASDVVLALHRLKALAPLHQPASLAAIEIVSRRASYAPQFGCFDTAFHSTQPRVNRILAVSGVVAERGVRRYGFHGLSYEHAAEVLRHRYGGGGRAVVAHLGAGASLCALKDGISMATTMGMTPLGGIPMATRSGDLDPGAVLYMLDALGMSASQVREMLYRQSGLMGLSGESGDLQILLASSRAQAAEAVAFFVESVQREIASLAGALGGLDTLVFTAGIGERAPIVRARIGAACAWMGVRIDPELNEGNADEIHDPKSAIRVLIVRANEEAMIINHMRPLLLV